MRASAWSFVLGRAADKNRPRALPLRTFWRTPPGARFMVVAVYDLSRRSVARRRIVVFLLACAAVWTISATVWNLRRPIHFDMAEAFALSHEPAVGCFKFSPLINWVTAAWFAVMPPAGWPVALATA
jgi:hypothetical protein